MPPPDIRQCIVLVSRFVLLPSCTPFLTPHLPDPFQVAVMLGIEMGVRNLDRGRAGYQASRCPNPARTMPDHPLGNGPTVATS
jgi:hypothetical protein